MRLKNANGDDWKAVAIDRSSGTARPRPPVAPASRSTGAHQAIMAEDALALAAHLRRALGEALLGEGLPERDLEELTQHAMARIVENVSSFRGRSRFTTWATALAIRSAYSTLRLRRLREGPHGAKQMAARGSSTSPSVRSGHAHSPGRGALADALHRAIRRELTEGQRLAILGVLEGTPLDDLAGRLGVSRNALHELQHGARMKLRAAILAAGFTKEDIELGIGA